MFGLYKNLKCMYMHIYAYESKNNTFQYINSRAYFVMFMKINNNNML